MLHPKPQYFPGNYLKSKTTPCIRFQLKLTFEEPFINQEVSGSLGKRRVSSLDPGGITGAILFGFLEVYRIT